MGTTQRRALRQAVLVRRHTRKHHTVISLMSVLHTVFIAMAGASAEVFFVSQASWAIVVLTASSVLVVVPVLVMDFLEDRSA